MSLSPIVLFVYNRPDHTKRTIEALKLNNLAIESHLIIYSDGAKNEKSEQSVKTVRKYIDGIEGFLSIDIVKRTKNLGLANSIIKGVSEVIERYGKVIVLEDDLITSPHFLSFMNQCLDTYENRNDIFSITGFSFSQDFMKFDKEYMEDVYLNIRPMSWSWATWKNRWENVDWDEDNYTINSKQLTKGGNDLPSMLKAQIKNKLDSWYIRWTYNAIKDRLLTVYPRISYINNQGFDGSGVHCDIDEKNIRDHSELNTTGKFKLNADIKLNQNIISQFNKGFYISPMDKLKFSVKKIIKP